MHRWMARYARHQGVGSLSVEDDVTMSQCDVCAQDGLGTFCRYYQEWTRGDAHDDDLGPACDIPFLIRTRWFIAIS